MQRASRALTLSGSPPPTTGVPFSLTLTLTLTLGIPFSGLIFFIGLSSMSRNPGLSRFLRFNLQQVRVRLRVRVRVRLPPTVRLPPSGTLPSYHPFPSSASTCSRHVT